MNQDLPAPVMCVHRERENNLPLYIGTGDALMSMLRTFKNIRDQLKITTIFESGGFACKWTCVTEEGNLNEGFHTFHVDLTRQYCLYTKQGYDEMACVKLKPQFDRDCFPKERKPQLEAWQANGELPYVIGRDWFASEAYTWTLRSTIFMWSCAILTVFLRWFGTARGWDWVNEPVILLVTISTSGAYALRSDFMAMKWRIVPWLQKVRKLKIMGIQTPFEVYFIIRLLGTCFQTVTIQNNAWFMVGAVQENDNVLCLWTFLWEHSSFGFLAKSTWTTLVTPRRLAILFWCLSTTQLVWPLVTGMPWQRGGTRAFPPKDAQTTDSGRLLNAAGCTIALEAHHKDFMTFWSKLVQYFLEAWGVSLTTCTYGESVGKLALASGLRYVGSTSMSYQLRLINEIIAFKKGFYLNTDTGLELLPQGWELRSLEEFQKLAETQMNRVTFIMLCKLALQMNLQITFIIINRIQEGREHISLRKILGGDITRIEVFAFISISSLLVTFLPEVVDVYDVVRAFLSMRTAIKETVFKLGMNNEVYATNDFVVDDGSIQSMIYSGKDLKQKYYRALRKVCQMVFITIFCLWLVGYALLKVIMSVECENGAWEFHESCLDPILCVNQASQP